VRAIICRRNELEADSTILDDLETGMYGAIRVSWNYFRMGRHSTAMPIACSRSWKYALQLSGSATTRKARRIELTSSSLNCEICLTVAVQIELAQSDAALDRLLQGQRVMGVRISLTRIISEAVLHRHLVVVRGDLK
jgi:hypothetical protein